MSEVPVEVVYTHAGQWVWHLLPQGQQRQQQPASMNISMRRKHRLPAQRRTDIALMGWSGAFAWQQRCLTWLMATAYVWHHEVMAASPFHSTEVLSRRHMCQSLARHEDTIGVGQWCLTSRPVVGTAACCGDGSMCGRYGRNVGGFWSVAVAPVAGLFPRGRQRQQQPYKHNHQSGRSDCPCSAEQYMSWGGQGVNANHAAWLCKLQTVVLRHDLDNVCV